jgi:hypothetical protein
MSLTEQCTVAEQWRSAIATICMICWVMAAAFIVMSA